MQVKVYEITWGETQTTTGAVGGSVVTYSIAFSDQGVQGQTGPQGPIGEPNTLAIGTVVASAPGGSAVASITGASPNQILSLTIPRGVAGPQGPQGPQGSTGAAGANGPANSLTIGTVTTGNAGSSATATITGAAPNQTLNLAVPRGDKGEKGDTGPQGPVGPQGATGPAGATGASSWNDLTDKPSTFTPSAHTHPANQISDSTGSGRTLLTSNLVGARAHLSLFPSFANRAAFPATGDVDRVYTALDTSKIYVWVSSSSTYVEVSPQVKADWNATSGDAEILNKPSSFPPSAHNHDDLYFNAAVPWTANHTLVDGTRYLAGDVVHSGGRIYRAKFDNESIPVTDPVYWQDLGPGNRLNIDGRDIANIPKADWNATSGDAEILNKPALNFAPTNLVGSPIEFVIACSNETPALTAGVAKVTFRAPVAFRLTSVSASVTVAPTGSTLIVDINNGANSVLSTKLSIDATEKTSATAATAAVVDTSFRDFTQDAEITIDIDQIGSTVAGAGLKVILGGTRL